MSVYSDIQVLVSERPDSSSAYTLRELFDVENDCGEGTGLSTFKIAASTGPTEITLGSIAKGKVLVFSSSGELTVHINGSGVTSFAGTFAAIELDDTTGLTSLHVTNDTSAEVTYQVYVAGDVS